MKHPLRVISALAALVFCLGVGTAHVFASTDLDAMQVDTDQQFTYTGYTIDRFSGPTGKYQIVPGTQEMRDAGVLLIEADMGVPGQVLLMILKEGTHRLESTGYTLYVHDTGLYCATSQCQYLTADATWFDGRIVAMRDGSWYLYNPVTGAAEKWFTPPSVDPVNTENCAEIRDGVCYLTEPKFGRNVPASSGVYRAIPFGTGLVFTSTMRLSDPEHFVGHFVSAAGRDEVIYEKPNVFSNGMWSPVDTRTIPEHPSFLNATSVLPTGEVVGQIDTGVYISKGDHLTRIGYSRESLNGGYGVMYSASPKSAMAFGSHSVAWVGENGALYVATLDLAHLPTSIVQDIPLNTPFRFEKNSTVYLYQSSRDVWLGSMRRFDHASEYQATYADPKFSKVVTISDKTNNKGLISSAWSCATEPSKCQ